MDKFSCKLIQKNGSLGPGLQKATGTAGMAHPVATGLEPESIQSWYEATEAQGRPGWLLSQHSHRQPLGELVPPSLPWPHLTALAPRCLSQPLKAGVTAPIHSVTAHCAPRPGVCGVYACLLP